MSFPIVTTFLLLSLSTHLILYLGLLKIQPDPLELSSKNVPIELIVKNSPEKKRQFVSDPDLGALSEKLKKQSRLLSKYTRRVKKESVASLSGPTKNNVPKQAPTQKIVKRTQKKKSPIKDLNGGLSFRAERKQEFQDKSNHRFMPSTIAEHIPNVKRGGFTVLNTDQFTYYSFFSRINEQIRLRWVQKIRNFSYTLPAKTINQLALFSRSTKVELVLNKKGEFISSFVDQSSGAEFLDRATIDAFIEASPFINPPQDLVDADGFIRLNYSFFVEWQSRHLAKD